MCKYCTTDDDKWKTYEKKISLGVLGKESYAVTCVENQKLRFYIAVDNSAYSHIMNVKIKYCPFCGRKL